MRWLDSLVERTKVVHNRLSTLSSRITEGAKWVWNNASLKKASVAVFHYGVNTFFYGMEQIMALRKSTATLKENETAKNIASELYYLATRDVFPFVAIN